MRPVLATLYVVGLILLAGSGVGAASRSGTLVWAALPFAALLIVALRWLGPRFEKSGWAAFTCWLGLTYVQGGGAVELGVFFLYLVFTALGLFRSFWFIAVAWPLHIVWDFMPHELPAALADLPVACMLFDGLIGAYLVVGAHTGRWATANLDSGRASGSPASERSAEA